MNASGAGAEFFDDALGAFERAQARAGALDHELALGGSTIRLSFAGPALEPFVLPPLAHLMGRTPIAGDPALTIAIFDGASTAESLLPLPWASGAGNLHGEIAGLNDDRFRTVFQHAAGVLYVYDSARHVGVCWTAAPESVPWWEWSAPLRTIVHWWTVPTSWQPVHAAAVGRDGHGVLVVGVSGAGKSTTALACLEAGFDYAGDDYVLVDVDDPTAYGLYSTGKLEPRALSRFPSLAPLVANPERLEGEKALVFLHDHRPAQLVDHLRLHAIVLPQVDGGRESHLEPISPAAALRVLAPTTTMHLPGSHREVFTKLNRLVRALPCHRLHAGTDFGGLTAAIGALAVGAGSAPST